MKQKLFLSLVVAGFLTACGGSDAEVEMAVSQSAPARISVTGKPSLPSGRAAEVQFSYNTWFEDSPQQNAELVNDQRPELLNWQPEHGALNTYFSIDRATRVTLGLEATLPKGTHKLKVSLNRQEYEVTVRSSFANVIAVGEFDIPAAGYQKVKISSTELTGSTKPQLQTLHIWPADANARLNFLDHSNPYWGRRGPSVHLNYDTPQNADIEWFYSEITVPSGQDIPGSYFMTNGFAEGYFGIQVNSDVERRVLFSVWSPFQTDDPSQIPADQRIQLLAKGDGVYTGEFGNEGAGGQSYLKHYWRADSTYSFLLRVSPNQDNSTDYSAWFKAASESQWQLIASFRRPQTSTYATRLHSFLENFLTQYGDQPRSAWYQNQWVRDTNEQWHELTQARFSVDATGRDENRLDFQGGSTNEVFYLRNGGFIYPQTTPDSRFARQPSAQAPYIELPALP